MRLRLVHTLSLLLLSAVLLAVLAMGAVTAWNLQNGFADYLAARDAERLEQFAALVAKAAAEAGGIAALQQRRLDMRSLLEEFALRQGLVPRRGRSLKAGPVPTDGPPLGERPPGGPPPDSEEGFGARVAVVGVDGQRLLGRPMPPQDGPFTDRPIRLDGEVVALARLRPGGRVPDAVESSFLRSQYLGIFAVATLLLLLAVASAWWLARRWTRPLRAVQDASARIARGEFDVRVNADDAGRERGDEIGDVVRNINRMAEDLQRLEGSRRRWLADISHELRTPLTALRGEIEALVDGVRPLRPEAMLSLRDDALRLGALVDDLHLLAMSDLQALPCQFADIDAMALIEQSVQQLLPRARAMGLQLSVAAGSPTSLAVHWDSARIEQLLRNLLENSLRYTDAPGRIVVAIKAAGDRILIDVDDSAPGVPAADLPRLFEPLYRADPARSRHHGGSGLGLAICDAIARSHGGHVGAGASALGGLHVHIELARSAGASA
jgi:two-component system sensor histidine kinase BaeS